MVLVVRIGKVETVLKVDRQIVGLVEMLPVNLTRENIKNSPEYKEESQLARDYEADLHQHYNQEGYWTEQPTDKRHSADK